MGSVGLAKRSNSSALRGTVAWLVLLFSSLTLLGCAANNRSDAGSDSRGCYETIPAIVSGFGSDGIYMMGESTVANPSLQRSQVTVFLPEGTIDKRPVIFFSHGYGSNNWNNYAPLIRHIVSRGYIVVDSTYPMLLASNDERYDALWQGFEAAVAQFGNRMDLERVGFVGHSFGGGATPAMAYHGVVERGWGRNGAFMMEMAPWYVLQMSPEKWQQFPERMIQLIEVYDQDAVNDHRMAIDIYRSTTLKQNYYFLLHSTTLGGCSLKAGHSTPARSQLSRLKQYGVYRPLDAVAECAFEHSRQACDTLPTLDNRTTPQEYQPLSLESNPAPIAPQSFYRFPWSGRDNPQLDSAE